MASHLSGEIVVTEGQHELRLWVKLRSSYVNLLYNPKKTHAFWGTKHVIYFFTIQLI
jgi:hypothetical protein